ncbi:MAG: hypothetical protein H0Z24_05865 [Thermosipho sp. (in: Bacteria)]|nr:hypothetical protein [Thermosipho sp. (in: thermotogales)]
MKRYFGFNARIIMNNIKGSLIKSVFAEEGNDDPSKTNQDDGNNTNANNNNNSNSNITINFEDLISKARKEEKAKLYPQIEDLKKKNADLVEKNNKLLLEVETKNKEIETLKSEIENLKKSKVESESETVKRLNKEIEDLKAKLEQAENSKVDRAKLEEEIEAKLKAEYEVKLYRLEKLSDPEIRDKVIPELVTGTTKEEIDKAIEFSKKKYEEIVNSVMNRTRVSTTVNPDISRITQKEFNLSDIQNMSVSEWAEYRKKLGLR